VIIVSNKDKAISCFKDGFNCSQAVFSTFAPLYDLDYKLALRVAGAFGGGMGSMGETCGAVTGSFMVIGLEHGKVNADDKISKGKTYRYVQEFTKRFEQKYGSIKCKILLGYDLNTEEGIKMAKEKGLFINFCPGLIEEAVDILEQLIKEEKLRRV